nr:MAG TPA: hypothetical protein [Caudoviricetes sp.]
MDALSVKFSHVFSSFRFVDNLIHHTFPLRTFQSVIFSTEGLGGTEPRVLSFLS